MFLLVLLLFIGLCVEIFRYVKIKANAFSEKEVKAAAELQAKRMRIEDPEISCDYCGSKIDTSKYKVCPHCGAPYDNDEEWLAKFKVDEEFVNESTDRLIALREEKASEKSRELLRSIKNKIRILVILNVLIIVFAVAFSVKQNMDRFRENEKLNESTYEQYAETDYKIEGDRVIYDDGMVKITISGIYQEDDEPTKTDDGLLTKNAKVGFIVENNSDKNVNIAMECNSVNGFSTDSFYISDHSLYRKNKAVTVYERIRLCPGEEVSEMIFDSIEVYSSDYKYQGSIEKPVIVRTTSKKTEIDYSISGNKLIYSDDKVDVYSKLIDGKGFGIYAANKSDKAYKIDSDNLIVDGKAYTAYGLHDVFFPNGYILRTSALRSYAEEFDIKTIGEKNVQTSFSFTCVEDPSINFATGYVNLN